MNYTIIDFISLLGAVCLFLYGMKVMSEGLQKVAGDRLRNILGIMTKNRVTGILTGIVITALIQSSSASTVMVVSFVNAGLMSLAQSMAVIFGANVGTPSRRGSSPLSLLRSAYPTIASCFSLSVSRCCS